MIQIFPRRFYDAFRPVLDSALKTRWNLKWKRSYVLYNAKGKGSIDIRTILNGDTEEEINKHLMPVAKIFDEKYHDDRMISILKLVHNYLRYKGDFEVHKTPEYWQTATETFKLKTGDCEDGACLIHKLAILSGIPEWRIKLSAGDVTNPKGGNDIGHGYIIYLSEQYNEWFTIDWCYYYSLSLNYYLKIPHSANPLYKNIWWTTNNIFSWAQHDTFL